MFFSLIFLLMSCIFQDNAEDPVVEKEKTASHPSISQKSSNNKNECLSEVILANSDGTKTILYLKCSSLKSGNPISDDSSWGNPNSDQDINVHDIFYVIPQPPGDPVPNIERGE